AEAVATGLGVAAVDVLVCSTGLICDLLVAGVLARVVTTAFDALSDTGGDDAARAIMRTATIPRVATHRAQERTIPGIAKEASTFAPGLATMLVVITTDAVLDSAALDAALREATRLSFDRLDSDGCMSTNDQVTLLASAASGI